ncbi:FmdB family zinc ribbon protein [Haloterrigena salifodinae]|uniref:FmdB family zinc ribbon protein n=1 Tax=Haloterrigena salifodinae TaxID=2675099 RepID=UPI000F87D066|nr:zinc ribbon domain-containing protein [Haloterrigena salifodinae]
MSMFERLGEKVERFKQEAVAAREDSAPYRCRDCENRFHSERETCPACGSSEVERVSEATESDVETNADPDTNAESETNTRTEVGSETETETE